MAKNNKNGVAQPVVEEESFVQKNLKKIAICVAVVIVAIIAAILINNFLERRNQKAAEAMFPCEQLFQQGQFEKALAGDGQQVLGFAEVGRSMVAPSRVTWLSCMQVWLLLRLASMRTPRST